MDQFSKHHYIIHPFHADLWGHLYLISSHIYTGLFRVFSSLLVYSTHSVPLHSIYPISSYFILSWSVPWSIHLTCARSTLMVCLVVSLSLEEYAFLKADSPNCVLNIHSPFLFYKQNSNLGGTAIFLVQNVHFLSLSCSKDWPCSIVMNNEMEAKFPKDSFFLQVKRISMGKPLSLLPFFLPRGTIL